MLGSTDHGFPVSVKPSVGLKLKGDTSHKTRLGFEYKRVVISSKPIDDKLRLRTYLRITSIAR